MQVERSAWAIQAGALKDRTAIAKHFVASLDAGKHVYQEKTMAFTVDHAKRMRASFQRAGGKRVVQIGIRAQCIEEAQFIRRKKVNTFYAHDIRRGRHSTLLKNWDDVAIEMLGDDWQAQFPRNQWRANYDYSIASHSGGVV